MGSRRPLIALLVLACLAAPADARRGGFRGGRARFGGYSTWIAPAFSTGYVAFDDFEVPPFAPVPAGYRTLTPEESARVADAGHAQRLATAGSPSVPTMVAPQPAPVREYVPPPPEPPRPPAEPRTIEVDPGESAVTVIRRGNGITEIVPR